MVQYEGIQNHIEELTPKGLNFEKPNRITPISSEQFKRKVP